jgi:hypothetical protein
MKPVEYQAYIALAQDLRSDDAEWSVFTGKRAYEAAAARLDTWCARDGQWIGHIRKIANDIEARA